MAITAAVRDPATHARSFGLDPARLPRHLAVIMDGNGRWAARRALPRHLGHRAGARAVRELVESCVRRGIEALTLFAFSSENWARPCFEASARHRSKLMLQAWFFLPASRWPALNVSCR